MSVGAPPPPGRQGGPSPPASTRSAPLRGGPHLLAAFVARLLELGGAVVAPLGDDGLEVISPPELQAALSLPELARLGFGGERSPGTERVGLDPLWLERLGRALGDHGRFARRTLDAAVPSAAGAAKLLAATIQLTNGVYRLLDSEPAWGRYWLLALRWTARSDEKRDGLLLVGVNLGSASPVDGSAAAVLHEGALAAPLPSEPAVAASALPIRWPAQRLTAFLERGVRRRVGAAVAPFVASLERRLARDVGRLGRYYAELAREARQRGARQGADAALSASHVAAIAREQQAKVADLERRYAVVVEVEVVQLVEIVAPVRRLHLLLKRRKGERRFPLDWSAMTRQLEALPCEYSDAPAGPRALCDAALHLLSPEALAPCPGCGRERCFACQPRVCARCGAVGGPPSGSEACGLPPDEVPPPS